MGTLFDASFPGSVLLLLCVLCIFSSLDTQGVIWVKCSGKFMSPQHPLQTIAGLHWRDISESRVQPRIPEKLMAKWSFAKYWNAYHRPDPSSHQAQLWAGQTGLRSCASRGEERQSGEKHVRGIDPNRTARSGDGGWQRVTTSQVGWGGVGEQRLNPGVLGLATGQMAMPFLRGVRRRRTAGCRREGGGAPMRVQQREGPLAHLLGCPWGRAGLSWGKGMWALMVPGWMSGQGDLRLRPGRRRWSSRGRGAGGLQAAGGTGRWVI